MLIAVEGIDGAGKTTLLDRLATHLEQRGREVVRVRRYMLPEVTELWWRLVDCDVIDHHGTAALAAADYRAGLSRYVRPALAERRIVLADKYVYTHHVYFSLRGLPRERVAAMFADALVPDVVLYLALPVDTALARLRAIDGKPDLLEAGLDHRLGLSIGSAFRRYGLGGAPSEMRESHFREHQTRAATLFRDVLPEEVTTELDASLSQDELFEDCVERLDV
jgi:thymidylate kinase